MHTPCTNLNQWVDQVQICTVTSQDPVEAVCCSSPRSIHPVLTISIYRLSFTFVQSCMPTLSNTVITNMTNMSCEIIDLLILFVSPNVLTYFSIFFSLRQKVAYIDLPAPRGQNGQKHGRHTSHEYRFIGFFFIYDRGWEICRQTRWSICAKYRFIDIITFRVHTAPNMDISSGLA